MKTILVEYKELIADVSVCQVDRRGFLSPGAGEQERGGDVRKRSSQKNVD